MTIDKLFQLLTEQDETLIIKTLELIRNLLCNRMHIDQIMSLYGSKIIQAIIMILESEYYNMSIKEQALCILANVADGNASKEFIMGNEDLLRKINSFMVLFKLDARIFNFFKFIIIIIIRRIITVNCKWQLFVAFQTWFIVAKRAQVNVN